MGAIELPALAFAAGTARPDPALAERIKRAYRAALPRSADLGHTMWTAINDAKRPIHDALMRNDDSLSRILLRPGDSALFAGFDDLNAERMVALRGTEGSAYRDRILAELHILAQATGAQRLYNPESGLAPAAGIDLDALLDGIERAIAGALRFPNPFPDECGPSSRRGIVSFRSVQSIYQAWRLRELSRRYGARILEIGAGLGRTAYYAHAFGLSRIALVDLPMSGVAQAAFLGYTLGPDRVALAGEPGEGASIRILPPEPVLESAESFDIVLNADSLTEMDEATARRYAQYIATHARAFLSINHEANPFCVRDFDCLRAAACYRQPYWLRAGYVEELFVFGDARAA
jgi:hypothetical protein